jgi:hypothetical protein
MSLFPVRYFASLNFDDDDSVESVSPPARVPDPPGTSSSSSESRGSSLFSSPGVFSSPSSVFSGATGGGRPPPWKSVLIYATAVPSIHEIAFDPAACCMGKIGNRGSVCLKAISACNVQSHKTKMRVRMEHFYIQSKQYQLWIEPSLDGELLPDDITTQSLLDGDPTDLDVLMAYVQNLQAKYKGLGATSRGSSMVMLRRAL